MARPRLSGCCLQPGLYTRFYNDGIFVNRNIAMLGLLYRRYLRLLNLALCIATCNRHMQPPHATATCNRHPQPPPAPAPPPLKHPVPSIPVSPNGTLLRDASAAAGQLRLVLNRDDVATLANSTGLAAGVPRSLETGRARTEFMPWLSPIALPTPILRG